MSKTTSIEIKGLTELEKKLTSLPKKIAKKIIRQSIRETANATVLKRAKSNAKLMVGGRMGKLIAKHLKYKAYKKQRKGQYAGFIWISPKGNDDFVVVGKDGKRNYIPNAIEFGHDNVKPVPYLRKAFKKGLIPAQIMLEDYLLQKTKAEFEKK